MQLGPEAETNCKANVGSESELSSMVLGVARSTLTTFYPGIGSPPRSQTRLRNLTVGAISHCVFIIAEAWCLRLAMVIANQHW